MNLSEYITLFVLVAVMGAGAGGDGAGELGVVPLIGAQPLRPLDATIRLL